jgi:hypothetical protein
VTFEPVKPAGGGEVPGAESLMKAETEVGKRDPPNSWWAFVLGVFAIIAGSAMYVSYGGDVMQEKEKCEAAGLDAFDRAACPGPGEVSRWKMVMQITMTLGGIALIVLHIRWSNEELGQR